MGVGHRQVAGQLLALICAVSMSVGAQATPVPVTRMPMSRARMMIWPIKTREHVDLWLHGFAMLDDDTTAAIPLFRPGYRDALTVLKNQANVLTKLDMNVDRLREQLHTDQLLQSAQFIPFYFSSLDEMRSTMQRFVATDGRADSARSPNETKLFAVLSRYFPTPRARAWLALFSTGLWDEDTTVFHAYWTRQQRERGSVIDSVQALWQNTVRPHLQGFLNNTHQADGDFLLCLPLAGEGRTLTSDVPRATVGVTFPEHPADAADAIYGFAHEIVGTVAQEAIRKNVTPAQQRSGVATNLESPAAVRGGLLLLETFIPDLADGYARYYLRAAGQTPGAAPRAELEALSPIPNAVRDAMARQMEVVHGGT
ncbi:MAG TPA: hypothetical protein VNU46_10270 [Gemmatimonadaceae bacterium]|jgi:hypothetical protein|nr:hypothetical protein [Gemmatimonadaceae bacterium]